jgi:D-proline reductase (dithiol) PrdB
MTQFPFYPMDKAHALERWAAEYVYTQTEPTPWTPLRRDLKDCRVALIAGGGIRLESQTPFLADRVKGCADYREVSAFANRSELCLDATGFDRSEVEQDLNVVVPVDRFKELVEGGIIRDLHETFFSFYGACTEPGALKASASAVAERLKEGGVHAVFLFPADLPCNETLALVARELERDGLSTATLVTVREVAQQIRPPRALFINFPFGRTLGRAHARSLQESIVGDMVRALKTLDRPGKLVELPYQWDGPVE